MTFDKQIIQAAWREYRVAWAYSHGAQIDEVNPPRKFIREELGFSFDDGPSLAWTCLNLSRRNQIALILLGFEAPRRVTYPLASKPHKRVETTQCGWYNALMAKHHKRTKDA